jgi:hypothetical protein
VKVKPIESATGLQRYAFVCPGCAEYDEPGSRLFATHQFDSTWSYNGDGNAPTVSPPILVTDGRPEYRCHSFVEGGKIRFLSDCSHKLAGQTVELPEYN